MTFLSHSHRMSFEKWRNNSQLVKRRPVSYSFSLEPKSLFIKTQKKIEIGERGGYGRVLLTVFVP